VKKRTALLLIILAIVVLLLPAGCARSPQSSALDPGETGQDSPEATDGQNDTAPGEETTPGDPAPDEADEAKGADAANGKNKSAAEEARKVKITLYFGDQEAIEDGTPTETGYVKAVTREYPHTTAVLRLALQELIRGPLPGEKGLVKTLPATVQILNLKIENEVALIDFSDELLTAPDSPAGTLGSLLLVQSVVYTATQFPTVKSVLVTVDGETYSDGHYIWEEPIGRGFFCSSG